MYLPAARQLERWRRTRGNLAGKYAAQPADEKPIGARRNELRMARSSSNLTVSGGWLPRHNRRRALSSRSTSCAIEAASPPITVRCATGAPGAAARHSQIHPPARADVAFVNQLRDSPAISNEIVACGASSSSAVRPASNTGSAVVFRYSTPSSITLNQRQAQHRRSALAAAIAVNRRRPPLHGQRPVQCERNTLFSTAAQRVCRRVLPSVTAYRPCGARTLINGARLAPANNRPYWASATSC